MLFKAKKLLLVLATMNALSANFAEGADEVRWMSIAKTELFQRMTLLNLVAWSL